MGACDIMQPAYGVGLRRVLRPLRLQAVYHKREKTRIDWSRFSSFGGYTVFVTIAAPKYFLPNQNASLSLRQPSSLSDRFVHLCNHSVQRDNASDRGSIDDSTQGLGSRPSGSRGHMWTADQFQEHLQDHFEVMPEEKSVPCGDHLSPAQIFFHLVLRQHICPID